jgi:putative NADH-flavin reductase
MKIAIIGATRGIGAELLKIALAEGHEVTVLARDPSRIQVTDKQLRIVEGDALNINSINKVVKDQDVVCNCLGTTNVTQKISMFSACAENLAKILTPNQLLIAVTGIGTGDSKGHGGFLYDRIFMPLVLRRMYDDKEREEQIIKSKISRWIIVRPGFLNNGPRTSHYRALTNLKGVNGGKISRADVAHFILAQAKSLEFIGQTPLLIY